MILQTVAGAKYQSPNSPCHSFRPFCLCVCKSAIYLNSKSFEDQKQSRVDPNSQTLCKNITRVSCNNWSPPPSDSVYHTEAMLEAVCIVDMDSEGQFRIKVGYL